MVTIKDVAKYTGVSPTTVSNVIHGRTEKVSIGTKEKVEKALKELNYSSNMAGRLLAKHGSKIIAVLFQDFDALVEQYYENPYQGELIQSLEFHIREKGYFMMFHRIADYKEGMRLVNMWDIEGVILSGAKSDDIKIWQENVSAPIVFLDLYCHTTDASYFNVGLDDFGGAFEMVSYIASKGLKDILFIAKGDSHETWVGVDERRAQGAKKAAETYGVHLELLSVPSTYRYYQKSVNLLREKLTQKYRVLFFSSDLLAVQFMSEFWRFNINVPRDVSIVSFDGTPFAKYANPPITSVYQDLNKKAEKTVNLLIDIINHKTTSFKSLQLQPEIFLGKSLENDFKKC